mmetsp:Transcript_18491/g.30211  ORF Transcript_18491/g.30211 Transcript_18491/m.30211 type:complete len:245 (-) Transcript_18491:528-1262(-)
MGRHKRVAGPGDAGHKDLRRCARDDPRARPFSGCLAAVGHKCAGGTPVQQALSRLCSTVELTLAQQPRLFEVHIKRTATVGQKRAQPLGLAGGRRGHTQIRARQHRAGGDLAEQINGQIAIKGHETVKGRICARQRAIGQGPQDFGPRRLQRMGVCDGCDQAVRPFNRHITVGWQIVGAIDGFGHHAARGAGGHQFVALGVPANSRQQGRGHAKTRKGHRDVHGHAARQAGDAPGHVRSLAHGQ